MVFQQIRHLFITLDATDKASRKLKQVNRAANNVSAAQERAAQKTRKFRKRMVAAGFGAAILTGAMAKMVQVSSEVSRTFARIAGTSGATADQMQRIRGEAERIGAEMPVLMTQAAEAFEQLSYAGFTVEEQLEASNSVVELAIAGNIKMGEAARTASSAIRAFGMNASEVSQITETMAATFTNSAFNMGEMAQALEYAMSTASQADQAFSEVAAALGTLADIGLRGTKAGTALERMFTRLAKQNGETADAMQKLGLTMTDLTDQQGDFKDLSDIVQILGGNIEEMSSGGAETLQLLQELFGARGGRAAAGLVNNTDAFIKKIGDNARAEIGSTIAMLSEMNDEELSQTNDVLNTMVSQYEDISFDIGENATTESTLAQLVEAAEVVDDTDMANAVNMAFEGISEKSASILARDVAALKELRAEAGNLSDQELSTRVQSEFNMGESDALDMSEAIRSGEGVQYLARSIDDMTTSADLAEKQVQSLWGQIEFLQGSIETLIIRMVAGMKPALDLFFGGAKALFNILLSNRAVVKGLGLGMAALTATLIALTAAYAKLAISNHLVATGFWNTTTASSAATASLWAQNFAAAAVNANFAKMALMLKSTSAYHYAHATAAAVSTAAQWAFNNSLTFGLASIGMLVSAIGAFKGGLGGLAVAAIGAAVAVYVFYNAASLGLVNIIYIVVGAVMALVGAFAALTAQSKDGASTLDVLGDTLDGIISPIMAVVDAIMWTLDLLYELTMIGIGAVIWAIGGAFHWTGQRVNDFVDWLKQLPLIGPAVVGTINAVNASIEWMNNVMDDAGQSVSNLGSWWDQLGMAIGDAIRWMLGGLSDVIPYWDAFTRATNETIGAIATLIEDGLLWLEQTFSLVELAALALGAALLVALGPIGIAIAAIVAVGWLLYDNWDAIVSAVMGIIDWFVEGTMNLLDMFVNWLAKTFPRAASVMGDLGEWMGKLGTTIDNIVNSIISIINDGVSIIVDSFTFLGKFLLALGGILAVGAKKAGEAVFNALIGPFNDAVDYIKGLLGMLAAVVMSNVMRVVNVLKLVGGMILMAILIPFINAYDMVKPYLEQMAAVVDWMLGGMADAVKAGADLIMAGVDWLVGAIVGILDVGGAIVAGIATALVGLTDVFLGFFEWMLGGIADFIGGFADYMSRLAGMTVNEIANSLVSAGAGLIDALVSGIVGGGELIYNAVKDALGVLGPLMPSSDAKTGPLSNLTGWGGNIMKTIADGIKGAGGKVGDAIGNALGGLGQSAMSGLKSLGGKIAGGIASGIDAGAGMIKGAVDGAVSGAKNIGGKAISGAKSLAGAAKNTIGSDNIQKATDMAKNAGGAVADTGGELAGKVGLGAEAKQLEKKTNQIVFQGEVHDAQKVKDQVRKGMDEAADEAENAIDDGLDMASDAAGDIGGMF